MFVSPVLFHKKFRKGIEELDFKINTMTYASQIGINIQLHSMLMIFIQSILSQTLMSNF